MKLISKTPNIIQYKLKFEPQDEFCNRCMWAIFNIDIDNYTLSITSDCGDFPYSWGTYGNEQFKTLLSGLSKDYLIGKLADKEKLNHEKSIEKTIENLKYYYDPGCHEQDLDDMISDLENIESCNVELFYSKINNIVSEILDFEAIEIIIEYPQRTATIVDIFIKYIQPEIKKGGVEMNNRHRFRGISQFTNEMVFGNLRVNPTSGTHFITDYSDPEQAYTHYVVPKTVGQCTGGKDKNGVLVYEGDIIKEGRYLGTVIYSFNGFTVRWKKLKEQMGREFFNSWWDRENAFEVIQKPRKSKFTGGAK